MAGKTTRSPKLARTIADLLPAFGVLGGRIRMAGPDFCPTGH
jgi:hypothetical protein